MIYVQHPAIARLCNSYQAFISIRAFENRLDMLRFLSFKTDAFC